ncbi:MAG: DinB family protein [Capsulimonadales bacterium]|nr:DinB family protein [Capsulimonadales bacterium]
MVDVYWEALDLAYYEVNFAFEGLSDENVRKRPTPDLLSIGELAGHIAYWEAVRLAGDPDGVQPDPARCRVKSPLIDRRFAYYPQTLSQPPSDTLRTMTAEQVRAELLRVHEESVRDFRERNPDLDAIAPGSSNFTFRDYLKYAHFHVAYHTGQMYTVRHLLGDQTTDN